LNVCISGISVRLGRCTGTKFILGKQNTRVLAFVLLTARKCYCMGRIVGTEELRQQMWPAAFRIMRLKGQFEWRDSARGAGRKKM